MNFLTPVFLSLAGLALPVILLYMLRLRRREVSVSSTMLWQRLMQDREANAPWQRLRRNLLLLLQLAILAALVIALARPYLPTPSVAAGSVAVLVDVSASMGAVDMPGGASRLDAARDTTRALVSELASDEVMTIIAVGTTPEVISPPTSDRADLRESLDRLAVQPAPADWEAALALAGASVAGREQASIVIVSDGGLPPDLPSLPAAVRFISVGRESQNIAISALAVRPLDGRPQLFAAVTNYGAQPAETVFTIEVDGVISSGERMSIPPGDTSEIVITDLPETAHLIRAELTEPASGGVADYLDVDNHAYAVYTPPEGGRVLLVTEGNLFLNQLLAAFTTIEAYRAPPGSLPDEDYDLIIFDGYVPESMPDTNLLVINPTRSTDIFTIGEQFEDTRYLRQADNPILAFVDFRDIAIREARSVNTTGWARNIAEAEGGPLLIAGSVDGRRVAVLTFDLHASDLPLQIAFPILFANLFEWYAPSRPFDVPAGLNPGDPVTIRPQAGTTDFRVTRPDGVAQAFSADAGNLSFVNTRQPGFYHVELLAGQRVTAGDYFAVNLFSNGESMIAPAAAITVGEVEVTDAQPEDDYGQLELWPWLAAAALLVLFAEWWVYHRGSIITRGEQSGRERKPRQRLFYPGRRQ